MVEEKGFNSSGYYHLKSLTSVLLIFFPLTIFLFAKWLISDSPWYLWFFLVAIFIFIAFLRPAISQRKVRIENGNIIFAHRIGPPLTVSIAESLYEIVTKDDDEIRSFRFEAGKRKMQVSPQGYKDGDNLMKEITDVINREKIVVQIIEK